MMRLKLSVADAEKVQAIRIEIGAAIRTLYRLDTGAANVAAEVNQLHYSERQFREITFEIGRKLGIGSTYSPRLVKGFYHMAEWTEINGPIGQWYIEWEPKQ